MALVGTGVRDYHSGIQLTHGVGLDSGADPRVSLGTTTS
jgi:hypothetical protein